jgi:adenylate cyclase, class 2
MQETEAKFYVQGLKRIESRLRDQGAHLTQKRVLETNLRFDLPDNRLSSEGRVLRLRQATDARLTYKGPGTNEQGVLIRREIEFIVEDFGKARQFLEALGYQKLFYYEKYRTTYELEGCHIMLDELPYGNFVEIEGDSVESIQGIAKQLNLRWAAAIAASYHALFERLQETMDLSFPDVSFDDFAGLTATPVQLGVSVADK